MVNKQDFLNAFYQDIDMVKGDTMAFNLQLKGLQEAEPTIVFSCSESYNDAPIFTVDTEDGGITLESYDSESDTALYAVLVAPDKTEDMALGRYYYDLELTLDDNVVTLMRGRLTLLYGVKN